MYVVPTVHLLWSTGLVLQFLADSYFWWGIGKLRIGKIHGCLGWVQILAVDGARCDGRLNCERREHQLVVRFPVGRLGRRAGERWKILSSWTIREFPQSIPKCTYYINYRSYIGIVRCKNFFNFDRCAPLPPPLARLPSTRARLWSRSSSQKNYKKPQGCVCKYVS